MRYIKASLLIGVGLLTLGLAGCQSNGHQSTASFKNSSSQSSSYSAKEPDAAVTASSSSHNEEAQNYRPKAKQTRSRHYVKSGNLKKAGQYTFDKVGTQLTLDQVSHPKTTVKSGQLTYKVTTVRLIKNTAKTAAAKRMAAQALNLAQLKSPYYTLQVKFTIYNHGKQALTTDGIRAIQLSGKHQLNAANQLSDASAGKTIPANGKLATFATGLAGEKTKPTMKTVKIKFAGAFADKKQVVKPTRWLKLTL